MADLNELFGYNRRKKKFGSFDLALKLGIPINGPAPFLCQRSLSLAAPR